MQDEITNQELQDKQSVQNNTLGTLRRFMFEEMINLRAGKTEPAQAMAMSKLSHQVIESYKVEISAVVAANGLKDRNVKLIGNLHAIPTSDTSLLEDCNNG